MVLLNNGRKERKVLVDRPYGHMRDRGNRTGNIPTNVGCGSGGAKRLR